MEDVTNDGISKFGVASPMTKGGNSHLPGGEGGETELKPRSRGSAA